MTIAKQRLDRVVLFGLGSLLCCALPLPTALASSMPEPTMNVQEDGQDTLRQGLPGRRLGGGTRISVDGDRKKSSQDNR